MANVASLEVGGLVFDAAFDSGNLAKVEQGAGSTDFILTTRSDVASQPNRGTWFHFSVRGAAPGTILRFAVHNMNAQTALYEQGMRPVYRVLPSKPEWVRLAEPTTTSGGKAKDFAIHFEHTVSWAASTAAETLYFAFTYPHSYGECMARLAWLDHLFERPTAEVSCGCASQLSSSQRPARAAQAKLLLGDDTPDHSASSPASASNSATPAPGSSASACAARWLASSRCPGLLVPPLDERFEASRRAALAAGVGMERACSAAALATATSLAAAAAEGAAAALPAARPRGVYYRRELLNYSLEGRRIDLITITGHTGGAGVAEQPHEPPLLPEAGSAAEPARPERFPKKRTVLITSRVHPGETPASFVVDGLLEFLLRETDPRAVRLRAKFVFKIVPILNPDGVYEGKFRTDTLGVNLNRVYAKATHEAHPSVAAVLTLARDLHARGELLIHVDCHAHAGKRGCFLYGNLGGGVGAGGDGDVEAALYARLCALNSPYLDCDRCVFYKGEARRGVSGGSGREAVFAATRLPYIFTLECNYNSGRSVNELPPCYDATRGGHVDPRDLSPPPASRASAKQPYTPSAWRDVGKALGLAALDLLGVNPASRMGPSIAKGDGHIAKGSSLDPAPLDELRAPLKDWLRSHSVSVAGKAKVVDSEEEEEEEEPAEEAPVAEAEEEEAASQEEAAAPPEVEYAANYPRRLRTAVAATA